MCSQQDGRCELGFQKRIALSTILAWLSQLGEHRRSVAPDHLVGMDSNRQSPYFLSSPEDAHIPMAGISQ